jgi:hypothetical protein
MSARRGGKELYAGGCWPGKKAAIPQGMAACAAPSTMSAPARGPLSAQTGPRPGPRQAPSYLLQCTRYIHKKARARSRRSYCVDLFQGVLHRSCLFLALQLAAASLPGPGQLPAPTQQTTHPLIFRPPVPGESSIDPDRWSPCLWLIKNIQVVRSQMLCAYLL